MTAHPHAQTEAARPRRALLVFGRAPAEEARAKGLPAAAAEGLGWLGRAGGGAWETHVFAPAESLGGWRGATATVHRQGGGDFGQRLEEAVARLRAGGFAEIVVVGTDCPQLTPAQVARAFAALAAGAALVLGPDTSGGVHLLGLSPGAEARLRGVAWRCGRDFAALAAGTGVALLPPLRDLDTPADWRALLAARPALGARWKRLPEVLGRPAAGRFADAAHRPLAPPAAA